MTEQTITQTSHTYHRPTKLHGSKTQNNIILTAVKIPKSHTQVASVSGMGTQSDPCTDTIFMSIVHPCLLYSTCSPVHLTKYNIIHNVISSQSLVIIWLYSPNRALASPFGVL
jgi:hypothetical protein